MNITITSVENMGEFLQVTATAKEGKETKTVSFCVNGLPPTEDGIFNALAAKFHEVPAPEGEKGPAMETTKAEAREPDAALIAKVAALEAEYGKAGKSASFPARKEEVSIT